MSLNTKARANAQKKISDFFTSPTKSKECIPKTKKFDREKIENVCNAHKSPNVALKDEKLQIIDLDSNLINKPQKTCQINATVSPSVVLTKRKVISPNLKKGSSPECITGTPPSISSRKRRRFNKDGIKFLPNNSPSSIKNIAFNTPESDTGIHNVFTSTQRKENTPPDTRGSSNTLLTANTIQTNKRELKLSINNEKSGTITKLTLKNKQHSSLTQYDKTIQTGNQTVISEPTGGRNMKKLNLEKNQRIFNDSMLKLESCKEQLDLNDFFSSNIESNFFDTFDDIFDVANDQKKVLDLQSWKTCVILEIFVSNTCVTLKVKSEASNLEARCLLKDAWTQLNLSSDDIVNIKAVKDSTSNDFEINNKMGMLVVKPDVLVSGTALMGSQYCARASILNTIYGSGDSCNKIMTIGQLVHELLEESLKLEYRTELEIKTLVKNLLKRSSTINSLYASELSSAEALEAMLSYAPQLVSFIQTYIVKSSNGNIPKRNIASSNWNGVITDLVDIEENVWCPRLGLKGKIDASVDTLALHGSNISTKKRVIPLELKTGKANFNATHLGQLALYNMMLNDLGFESPSGLLFYARENMLKEFSIDRQVERDLMIMRNNYVYYLTRKPTVQICKQSIPDDESDVKLATVVPAELPEPLNSNYKCSNCSSIAICAFSQSLEPNAKITLADLYKDQIKHLSSHHLKYFKKWIEAIFVETFDDSPIKPTKDIWRSAPNQRELKGKSLINVIAKGVCFRDGSHVTVFTGPKNEIEKPRDFRKFGINLGDYMVVSTNNRFAVDTGFVEKITKYSITLRLQRNLNARYASEVFHLDCYESENHSMYLFPLVKLMKPTETSQRLREIIIDKRQPTYSSKISKRFVEFGQEIMKTLNQMQQKAIYRCLAAQDYVLINGMPGTGKLPVGSVRYGSGGYQNWLREYFPSFQVKFLESKTQTIVKLIELLIKLDQTVLVSSHTNSAVDNVLKKIIQNKMVSDQIIMRLGSELRIDSAVRYRSEIMLRQKCTSVEELEALYKQVKIVGVTCLGANHPLLERRMFDVCIIDESTQVLQPIVLLPLFSARKFVLVGDPEQLPPLVKNDLALKMGLGESLFDRLQSLESVENLTLQYRMNKTVNELANHLTYQGMLMCANTEVRSSCLTFTQPLPVATDEWLREVCDTDIARSVLFLDTGNTFALHCQMYQKLHKMIDATENRIDIKVKNLCEAAVVLLLVETFLQAGVSVDDIGVITPYRSQVSLLSKVLKSGTDSSENTQWSSDYLKEVEVNTVDQYQGRDKNVIIYSCVKTNQVESAGILSDKRRLNVAVTRAKNKLILVGDKTTLLHYNTFQTLFASLQSHQIIELATKNSFEWATPMERLERKLGTSQ